MQLTTSCKGIAIRKVRGNKQGLHISRNIKVISTGIGDKYEIALFTVNLVTLTKNTIYLCLYVNSFE